MFHLKILQFSSSWQLFKRGYCLHSFYMRGNWDEEN